MLYLDNFLYYDNKKKSSSHTRSWTRPLRIQQIILAVGTDDCIRTQSTFAAGGRATQVRTAKSPPAFGLLCLKPWNDRKCSDSPAFLIVSPVTGLMPWNMKTRTGNLPCASPQDLEQCTAGGKRLIDWMTAWINTSFQPDLCDPHTLPCSASHIDFTLRNYHEKCPIRTLWQFY